ncbi:aspartate kinase [Cytobacillus sp. IB215316]|uniref:aspartate kinase n=1 Tax=Cytobacillus sp. IB215316 TaxID=3097354 RepID=UPI002A0AF38E|nr:aspartate kinase [Cytobacillus sp. IB215316]MDX8361929.1 aspartate kinase [Cytobacillus sp. IB215316]
MKVAKFGGSSVASAEQFRKVASIITADLQRKFVVVSAPGKRHKEDTKMTDMLITLAEKVIERDTYAKAQAAILQRYAEIAAGLELSSNIVSEIEKSIKDVIESYQDDDEQFLDRIKASGEDNNAKLMAFYLNHIGFEAHYVNPKEAGIFVSEEPGNANILRESYDHLYKLRNRSGFLIIPGFFGYSPKGQLVTFSRGGSDITGAIVAAGVHADLYENFTDVDSIYCVNPNIVNQPKDIKELSYREMRELSYAGFSVFHDEALQPVFKAKIPVCVKNTNNPEAEGTLILSEREIGENPVVGIASDTGFCSIYVSKFLMNREIGFGRRLLQILEDEGVSYEHTPSGIDNMSIILREHQLDGLKEDKLLDRIQTELHVDDISIERNLAMIMVVGEGMNHSIGIASKATEAFAKAEVNIEMINQGSSEVSMMFGVKASAVDRAVRSLYENFYK